MTLHHDLITRTGEAASRLAKALVASADVQYKRSLAPTDGNGGRSKGSISDPTAATATDEKRLALRAAVIGGEVLLENFIQAANDQAGQTERALTAWAGPRA